MGQRSKLVIMKGAPTKSRRKEFAINMAQSAKNTTIHAVVTGAPILSSREEYALDMEQKSKYAAMRDAPILPRGEGCVIGTEQHIVKRHAIMMDALTLP